MRKKVIPVRTDNVNLCEQMKNKCHSSPFDFVVSGNTDPKHKFGAVRPEGFFNLASLPMRQKVKSNREYQCLSKEKWWPWIGVDCAFIYCFFFPSYACIASSLVGDLTCVLSYFPKTVKGNQNYYNTQKWTKIPSYLDHQVLISLEHSGSRCISILAANAAVTQSGMK